MDSHIAAEEKTDMMKSNQISAVRQLEFIMKIASRVDHFTTEKQFGIF